MGNQILQDKRVIVVMFDVGKMGTLAEFFDLLLS